MPEAIHPEINVDLLMHEIRATVAQRQKYLEPGPASPSSDLNLASLNGHASLELQPRFEVSPNGEYHVNDFLKYHGAAFVRNAYLGLLKRPPDPSGSGELLAALGSGRLNKLDVLARLHYSTEGKDAGVKVSGLSAPAFIRRLERIPILGYLISLIIAVGRLPNLHRHLRESEFHIRAQQDRIVEHYESVHRRAVQNFERGLTEIGERTADLQKRQNDLEQQQNDLRATIASVREELAESDEALGKQLQVLESRHRDLTAREMDLREQLAEQERVRDIFHREISEQLPRATFSPLVSESEARSLDELYASFEDTFRGAREEIKTRLRVYLPTLHNLGVKSGVVDLGCGRGEWLELLRDEGIDAYGVDHNQVFVGRCRELGLSVTEGDVIHHLQTLPEASLHVISGFHIVEHVSFTQLLTMLDEIARVLESGGLAILETPNPENFMVGSHTFYTDPTHRNPIPSATLRFLLGSRGFKQIEVMKLRAWDEARIKGDDEIVKRFNEYFYSAPDYAIIARKP